MPTSIEIMTSERAHLSRDEMQWYASGELPFTEQHSIETHLEQCPLCTEAVEGLALVPATEALKDLQWMEHKHTDPTGKLVRSILLTGALLVGTWVAWEYGARDTTPEKSAAPTLQHEEEHRTTAHMTLEEERTLIEEVNAAVELPVGERISKSELILADATTTSIGATSVEQPVQPELIDTMEPKRVTIERSIERNGPHAPRHKRASRQLVFLHDLKIVDPMELYPDNRSRMVKTQSIGADRENRFDATGASIDPGMEIPYLQLMDDALAHISSQEYQAALWDMIPLLEAHPNDVNALFYSGLCYYNLGLFIRAKTAFDRTVSHPIDTFVQPAEWYGALCVEREEGLDSARWLFERIANGQGFYAGQARARLDHSGR